MRKEQLEYLKPILQQEIDAGAIAGAAIRVIHEDRTVYDERLGFADREKRACVSADTIYRLYSMTKPITCAAIMILYERGQLQLLAPVSQYLEGFRNQKVWTDNGLVDAVREVTIQDLLNMTAGVVYPDESFEAGRQMSQLFAEVDQLHDQGTPISTIEFCNRAGRIPLEFQPGERWRYGACADILGGIIEVVSGRKLGDFLRRELFEPLGMKDTDFYVPEEKVGRLAQIYDYKPEQKHLEVYHNKFLCLRDYTTPPTLEMGGAGLFSTMEDCSRFARMLVNGGTYNGTQILGRKTVEYMGTPQLTKEQAVSYNWDSQYGYNYGNLMRSLIDPVKGVTNGSVGEFGWDGWTGNYFFIDRKEKLVMLYMIQRCAGGNPVLIRKLRQVIYSSL